MPFKKMLVHVHECGSVTCRIYLVLHKKNKKKTLSKENIPLELKNTLLSHIILTVDLSRKDYSNMLATLVCENVDIHCLYVCMYIQKNTVFYFSN